jgi:hypothetical protein
MPVAATNRPSNVQQYPPEISSAVLGFGRMRLSHGHAAEKRDELAPPHVRPPKTGSCITE